MWTVAPIFVLLVVLAECSTAPAHSPATNAGTPTATPYQPASEPKTTGNHDTRQTPDQSAKDPAVAAEKDRIEAKLNDAENLSSSSVGVYGDTAAEIVNRSDAGVLVRVEVSYSYEYHCDGVSGAVDGLTTEAVYRIANESVQRTEVIKDVKLVC